MEEIAIRELDHHGHAPLAGPGAPRRRGSRSRESWRCCCKFHDLFPSLRHWSNFDDSVLVEGFPGQSQRSAPGNIVRLYSQGTSTRPAMAAEYLRQTCLVSV